MAVIYLNKYVGTFSPGNSQQSVVTDSLPNAAELLSDSINGIEPDIIQCTEKNIAVDLGPAPAPAPAEGILDLSPIYAGAIFGPLRLVPDEAIPIGSDVVTAYIKDVDGIHVADFTVDIIDADLGTTDISLTAIDTSVLIPGAQYTWFMLSTNPDLGPRVMWTGNVSVFSL